MGQFFRVKHGHAFKGEFFDSQGPYVLLTPGSFNEEGGFRDQGDKTKYYTGDVPDGFILDEGDVIIAMTEQAPGLLGSSAWIPEGGRFLHNQRLGRIVDLDQRRLNKRFLYYLFNSRDVRAQVSATATGGKVRHTAPERIAKIGFALPPLGVQRHIANVLSAYDDLIKNNRRRMSLLEEAARQLYREWFVRLRFPGHEHTRITMGVPEGWREVRFEEALAESESGGRPRGGAKGEEGVPSIGAENVLGIGQYDYSKEKYVSEEYFEQMTRGVVRNRDVLLYKDGANIGRASFVGEGYPHDRCAVNEHVFILRSHPFVGQSFLYFWMIRNENRHAIANLNANTAQPGISQEKLKGLRFLLPLERLTRAFNDAVEAPVKQIFALALMNRKLSAARDLLLPRLMSGEIAV
jgi:type I restriction enzyme S subunit